MELATSLSLIAFGFSLGGGAVWFWAQGHALAREQAALNRSSAELATLNEQLRNLKNQQTLQQDLFKGQFLEQEKALQRLISEREVRIEELKAELLSQAQHFGNQQLQLRESFKSLSQDVMSQTSKDLHQILENSFSNLQQRALGDWETRTKSVEVALAPITESLSKFDQMVRGIETQREGSYQALNEQVRQMMEGQTQLKGETSQLVAALRKPIVRGSWGELQLKNVVEMAGMKEHCDFELQTSLDSEDGKRRPDMLVSLPGGKKIVVDAKTPLEAYLNAQEIHSEEQRKAEYLRHAKHIRTHIDQLSSKAYWSLLEHTPDFVVLFLPLENAFSVALDQDPHLIEYAFQRKVILASPTNLVALLKTVAYGWQQEAVSENAREIANLGKELYERLTNTSEYLEDTGKNLNKAVLSYNKMVGNIENRVFSSARKFKDLSIHTQKELKSSEPIAVQTQSLKIPAEMLKALSNHV
jgi:DNA recombination protein RmuC